MRKFRISFLKTAFLSCFVLMLTIHLHSQSTANYTFATNTTGSLALDLNSNAIDMSIGTTQVSASSVDQGVGASAINIGFDFWLMGNRYTQFNVTTNGLVSLSSTSTSASGSTYVISGGTVTTPIISAFAADLGSGTSGKTHYKIVGTAPNRTLVIEFSNMTLLWTSSYTNDGTFQVRLYESTGVVEFVYGGMSITSTSSASDATVGIGFATNTTTNNLVYVTSSTNSSSVTASFTDNPTYSAGAITNLNSASNGSRRVYSFTPPSIADPTGPLTFSSITSTGMTVNWSAAVPTTNIVKYAVYASTDGGATYNFVNTTNVGTNLLAVSGLTPGITYTWKVVSVSEGALSTGITGTQATTSAATYYWVGSSGGDWNTAANWNTLADNTGSTLSTPATTDILIVDGMGTTAGQAGTISISASASIGALQITNSTAVTIQSSATTQRIITITGSVGDEFSIGAGSSVLLTSITNSVSIIFATGTGMTGTIAGTLTVAGASTSSTSNTANSFLTTGGTGTVVTVSSTGIINNTATTNISTNGNVTGSVASLIFANGSAYNVSGATSGAPWIPLATWGATSTVTLSGLTSSTSAPSNAVQNYGNLTFNCPAASVSYNFFGSNTATIQGNLTITATNTGIFRAVSSGTLNILGNLILTAGTFQVSSSGGTVNVAGNVNVNGGSFDISQSGASNLRVAGNFIQTAGTIAQTSSTGTLEFNGNNAQTLTLVSGSHGTNVINVRVNNTAGVDLTSAFSIRNLTISRGNLTGTGSLTYNGTSSLLTYNSTTGNQTSSAVEFPSSSGPSSLTINNITASPNNIVSIPFSRTLLGSSGILTLTSGILDNSTFTLTLSNNTTGGISGGSSSSFVKGAIERSLPASLVSGSTYNFPVGKGTYNPLALVNPTTNSGGIVTIKAEAFDTNAGGTSGVNMGTLNIDRYWAASITNGSANFTNSLIRLSDASVISNSAIASSATLTGVYDIVGGTSPTVVVGTSVTSVAPAATTLPGFYVLGTKAVNMAYTSSTTTQTITTSVPQNTTNAQIIGIQVVTSGNSSPINATSFTFNANGTTDINDITNAKLYYTGTSSTFATTTLVGTATPTIAAYQIVGTQTLAEGINYFWLTYDISPTAVVNNVIDGECTVVQVASLDNTPTVTAPSGSRTIVVGAVSTFPFNDDFETGNLNKWITVNGAQTNKWHAGSATNNGGTNAAYISNNSGTSNAYSTGSTSVVHFYRDITFPTTGSYRLKFDWKGNGESSFDDLRVFFVDVTTTPVAGTSLSSGQIGSTYVLQSSWQSIDLAFPSGYLGTTKRLVFSWRNDGSGGTQPPAAIDNFSLYLEQDMVYSSSTVNQSVTTSVNAASTNQQVIGIQVVTTGSLNPLTLSKLVLNATGTTSASDIANAKIFYTGVSSTFATTTQFGSTIATPTTTNFDVTGTQILAQGTNYFWLTYDINATAIHNNVVDGECVSITVAGTDYTPTTTAPSGSRSILNKTLTSVAGIQASSATLLQGSVNQQVLRLDFVVAGPSGGSLLLNSLDATYTGTLASDIATNGVKLFTTTTTTFSTTTPLGTAQSISGGIASFTGLNFNLPIGTSYVWVAFDINPGATINNIVDTKIAINGINVGGATFNGSEIDPAGSRTIRGPLVGDYFVGAGEVAPNYVTLTAAISDLNALGVSGSVRFLLKNTTYNTASGEVFPLVINSITGASAINTITIQPNAGVASSISGTSGVSASALIRLNGADYVTIDGINSGGSSLLIENTSITGGTAVIWVSSAGVGAGANNNQVKNCTIKAGLANTANLTTNTYGIVICGSTLSSTHTSITAGADNDNNTISGNNIIKARYGIYSIGASAANANTGTVINNNIIGPAAFGADAIGRGGIVVREEDGIQITGNEIRFVGGDFANATSGIDRVGITFGTDASWTATSVFVKNAVVSKNILHDIVDERTFSAAAISIAAADGANPTNNTIANNFIFNVKANGTSGDQTVGIGLTAGNGDRVVFNSIYLTGDTDPNASATAPTVSNFGISISSGTAVTNPLLRNNIVYMDLTSSSTTTLKNAAINVPTSYIWGTGNSNYNDLYILPANTQSNIGCIGGSGGTFHATLAAWQSAVSQDANSVNIAPDFTSSIDLHLTIANPSLDNAATPIVGLTKDIDDNDRNTTTPDIGADEFKSCATVTSSDDSGTGTLRAAITCVAENGKVFYDQPTTTTTILTAPLTIDKNVTIQGLSDVARPEITTDPAAASGIIINVDKTLTLQNVDIKSTNPAQTFSGAGNVSITGLTISKP